MKLYGRLANGNWVFGEKQLQKDTHMVDSSLFETAPLFICKHLEAERSLAEKDKWRCNRCNKLMKPTGWVLDDET